MPLPESAYTLALRAAGLLRPLLERGEGKLARGLRGRHGVAGRMEEWGAQRARDRPVVWFHAPSVGEGLQAKAVLVELRARRPDLQLVYTFFSPSAEPFAGSLPADFADYLPLDLPRPMREALDALRPDVLVFTKSEVWPNLSRLAHERGVRLALLSATLPPGSSRLSPVARPFLTPAHSRLDALGAISHADAERYAVLGVPAAARRVTGDARFDQVVRRAAGAGASPLVRRLVEAQRQTLVAGSTWPADEQRLLPAFAALAAGSGWRLILAPHEPGEDHLRQAEAVLGHHGLSYVRMRETGDVPVAETVLLVDRVGMLGDLYALADLAYVGGGWGEKGLHSVLEPAAFGVPVLFGPQHANAREAGELIAAGGAAAASTSPHLATLLGRWMTNPAARVAAGAAAGAYVRENVGAARRGADLVLELLENRRG